MSVDRIDARFDRVDQQFDLLEVRMDLRLERLDRRFDSLQRIILVGGALIWLLILALAAVTAILL